MSPCCYGSNSLDARVPHRITWVARYMPRIISMLSKLCNDMPKSNIGNEKQAILHLIFSLHSVWGHSAFPPHTGSSDQGRAHSVSFSSFLSSKMCAVFHVDVWLLWFAHMLWRALAVIKQIATWQKNDMYASCWEWVALSITTFVFRYGGRSCSI